MSETSQNKIEVVYTKAKLSRRLFAHFFDIGILFLSVAIFLSISNTIITNTGFYNRKEQQLIQLREDSKLYVSNVDIVTYVKDSSEHPTFEDKKNELATRINDFYNNSTYFSGYDIWKEYNQRKLDSSLFKQEGELVVENSTNYEALFNFYSSEVNDHAVGFLLRNSTYLNLVRYKFWTILIQTVSLLTFFFTIYYLVLPLTVFRRGRQTIGMKLEKIGLISVWADNISIGKYIGRFFFMFLVFVPINFVSFLLPSIVSTTMTYVTKTNSSLVNYVFNDYMVDVTNQMIYLNPLERLDAENKLENLSIENKDLRLK